MTCRWIVAPLALALAACGPQVRPEVEGLRASVPVARDDGDDSEVVYRLEWTRAKPGWLLFRPWVPVHVRYRTFLGIPCGREELLVPLRERFYWFKDTQQDHRASLDVPFWARSMTLQLGRSGLVIEREFDE